LIIIWFLSEFFSTSNVIMHKRKGGTSEVGKFMEKLRGDEVVRPGGWGWWGGGGKESKARH
jgi:hypothetical protein